MTDNKSSLKSFDDTSFKEFTKKVRIDVLNMICKAKSGHPGGSLSCVEILSVLYRKILNVPSDWKKSPDFDKRDRFILSKGHASAAFYSVLAHCNFFDTEELLTFRALGSRLQGHPSTRYGLEGIEASTGSLGQGLSMAVGVALGLKLDNISSKVYVLLGDGEMQEGSVWEALMSASHKKLDNLVVIIDRNKLQIDGSCDDVKSLEPLDKKLEAFGFDVEVVDGHSESELTDALLSAKSAKKPCAIIANTIKGKGISFMENNAGWHGKVPKCEEAKAALEELQYGD